MTAIVGFNFLKNTTRKSLRQILINLLSEYPTAEYGHDEQILKIFLCQIFGYCEESLRGRRLRHLSDSTLREMQWCEFIPAKEKMTTGYDVTTLSGEVLLLNIGGLL